MKQVRNNSNYKSKESTHKKAKFKNMSAEEKEEIDQKKHDIMKQVRNNSNYKSKESIHKKAKFKTCLLKKRKKLTRKNVTL